MQKPSNRPQLQPHPVGQRWPTDVWPVAGPATDVDVRELNHLVSKGFGPDPDPALRLNLALTVAHRGELVAERYGKTADENTNLVSWSMAKSIVHAMIGMLVVDGHLNIEDPAPIAEWADDGRSQVTIQHLLQMSSGLEFTEDYVDDQVSDVIEMLFGAGESDVAEFARSFPLVHEPGTVFNYSSGTTNILSGICTEIIGDGEAGVREFLQERLFEPLGMSSADPRFDKSGNFIGSSYLYATARDFLKFGYLYLRDGSWGGQQLLPGGWVDHARSPVPSEVEERYWYGAHWWLQDNDLGAFSANGYEGQFTIVVPERDLVIVRLGKTAADVVEPVRQWLRDIIECFPTV